MIVLCELNTESRTPSDRDRDAAIEAARLTDWQTYFLDGAFDAPEEAGEAMWHIPLQLVPTPAIWIGYLPSPERYQAIYEEAKSKNILLVNTPEESLLALEFDRWYSSLADLTPESVILSSPGEAIAAGETLGYPLFVKGAVRSRKEAGWNACVAETAEELQSLVNYLFEWPFKSRGKVIVRRLAKLRYSRKTQHGFPMGREYRVFVCRDVIVGYGYYWSPDDPLRALTASEETQVRSLALTVSRRLSVPFIAVDIGQEMSGNWIVIEVGDAQFAGTSETPRLPLWRALWDVLTPLIP